MNSKEALQNIRDYNNEEVYYDDCTCYENKFEKELEIIEKDLEILEIIKKSITHKYLFSKKIECLNSMVIGLSISEDTDFEKIKEWLEDDN